MFSHKIENDPLMDLYESQSLDQLNHKFKLLCENYFIEKFALAILLKKEEGHIDKTNLFSTFDNYPIEWMNYYKKSQYYLLDPVFLEAQRTTIPNHWHSDKFNNISKSQKKILSDGHDFGISRGTIIPLIPNGKFSGLLNLVDTNIHHPEVLYILSNASQIYINKKEYLDIKNKFNKLTEKETIVLSLKAEGYLSKQIASTLSISNATVIFHLGNIKKKLGFNTIEQAIFKYITILTNNIY